MNFFFFFLGTWGVFGQAYRCSLMHYGIAMCGIGCQLLSLFEGLGMMAKQG